MSFEYRFKGSFQALNPGPVRMNDYRTLPSGLTNANMKEKALVGFGNLYSEHTCRYFPSYSSAGSSSSPNGSSTWYRLPTTFGFSPDLQMGRYEQARFHL